MLRHLPLLRGSKTAQFAFIGLLSCVRSEVRCEMGFVARLVTTLVALVQHNHGV